MLPCRDSWHSCESNCRPSAPTEMNWGTDVRNIMRPRVQELPVSIIGVGGSINVSQKKQLRRENQALQRNHRATRTLGSRFHVYLDQAGCVEHRSKPRRIEMRRGSDIVFPHKELTQVTLQCGTSLTPGKIGTTSFDVVKEGVVDHAQREVFLVYQPEGGAWVVPGLVLGSGSAGLPRGRIPATRSTMRHRYTCQRCIRSMGTWYTPPRSPP